MALKFVDLTECEIFLCRFFADDYDGRMYIKPEQLEVVRTIETSSRTNPVWRLPEGYRETYLKKLIADSECFQPVAASLNIICAGNEKKSVLLDNTDACISFTEENPQEDIGSQLKICLDLVLAVISSVIDSCDVWSVSRFFGRVCPEVLPPLRRKAQETEGQLNIMSILISYVMTAAFEDNKGDDPVLSANFTLIKEFTDIIVLLADEIQKNEKPSGPNVQILSDKELIQVLIKKSVKYLKSVKKLSGIASFSKVNNYLNKHIDEICSNFSILKEIAVNRKQKRSQEAYTNAHVLAFALRDRLVCMDVFNDLGPVSPLFKTPAAVVIKENQKVSTVDQSGGTPKICKKEIRKTRGKFYKLDMDVVCSYEEGKEETVIFGSTASDRSSSSFSSSSTIDLSMTLRTVSSLEDSGIVFDESLDENKENLDPNALVSVENDAKDKNQSPSPKKRTLSMCSLNQTSTNQQQKIVKKTVPKMKKSASFGAKRKLKNERLETGQTELKRFFDTSLVKQ